MILRTTEHLGSVQNEGALWVSGISKQATCRQTNTEAVLLSKPAFIYNWGISLHLQSAGFQGDKEQG